MSRCYFQQTVKKLSISPFGASALHVGEQRIDEKHDPHLVRRPKLRAYFHTSIGDIVAEILKLKQIPNVDVEISAFFFEIRKQALVVSSLPAVKCKD